MHNRVNIIVEIMILLIMQCFEGTKEKIKKMFDQIELSISSYDTAWVAMVPSPTSPHNPCFPGCVNWLLDNQLSDGSWGPSHCDPLLTKDTLSSTLACILALRQWGVGEEQMTKGIFISSICHFSPTMYMGSIFFLLQASSLLSHILLQFLMRINTHLLDLISYFLV